MALTQDDIRLAAKRRHGAENTRIQIRRLSLDHPGIAIAEANAIQRTWIGIEVAEGRVVKGHIRPIETRKGDTIQADYGPYGTVSCYFA